jgi:hypothetical protein
MNCRFNLFIALVLALYLTTANSTSISIANNAYSNIVVAISPDVPNTWSETILKNIQVKLSNYQIFICSSEILIFIHHFLGSS